MFRLTREVRLYVGSAADTTKVRAASPNGHAGYPPLVGAGQFRTVRITLAGEPDEASGYVVNIKQIDEIVRRDALPILEQALHQSIQPPTPPLPPLTLSPCHPVTWSPGHLVTPSPLHSLTPHPLTEATLVKTLFDHFQKTWPNLTRVEIALSPYTSTSILAPEYPMIRFSQKFEFSAAHRLHNPDLSPQDNLALFGKCNNPHGHGHNYELQVTPRPRPDDQGQIMPIQRLEDIVHKTVIQKFDHKFLNIECPEFAHLNPTVENIAQTIYKMLKEPLSDLAAVTVWETPKTWCEYME